MNQHDDSYQHHEEPEAPGAFSWFFQQIGWFLRKLILWPIADSFRWFGRGVSSFFHGLRFRSPLAYIGATLAVCVTAGAVATAVYFYNQSEQNRDLAGQTTAQTAPVPAPQVVPSPTQQPAATPPPAAKSDSTLQGVVPNFDRTAAARTTDSSQVADEPKALVKASPAPQAGPLRVAHRFSTTFVKYEVGDKKAARSLGTTAIPRLARELRKNPPKLPASGKVPEASVMNVVKGKRDGKRMTVSVALLRTGATSELRLALQSTADGWKVSEVRG